MTREEMKRAFDAARRDDEAADLARARIIGIRALLRHMVTKGGLIDMVGASTITSFSGRVLLNTLRSKPFDREIRIATIAVVRSIVFVDITGRISYCAPSNPNDVYQFWDEATAIVDGHIPLLLDVVTSDKCTIPDDSFFHESTCTRYTHLMLNCSNGEMYIRRLPWRFWWMVDPDNRITRSFRDVSCGYDTRSKANCF